MYCILIAVAIFCFIMFAMCATESPIVSTQYVQVPVIDDAQIPISNDLMPFVPTVPSCVRRALTPTTENPMACHQCITTTTYGAQKVHTLLHTNIPPPQGATKNGICIHDSIQYDIYIGQKGKYWCSNPSSPRLVNLTLYAGKIDKDKPLYVNSTQIVYFPTQSSMTLWFDSCGLIDRNPKGTHCGDSSWRQTYTSNHKYLCHKIRPSLDYWSMTGQARCPSWNNVCAYTGGGYTGCEGKIKEFRRGVGNQIEITWEIQPTDHTEYYIFGIEGTGTDPSSWISFQQKWIRNHSDIKWSVYDTLAKAGKQPVVSEKARNLFIEFAESVAKTLGVTNCFVCGGTNMGEQWPWEAIEATAEVLHDMSLSGNITKRTQPAPDTRWTLTTNLVGKACYKQNISGGIIVGDQMCLGYWEKGSWFSESNFTATPHDFTNLLQNSTGNWTTPKGMYWICGNLAYEYLPARWSGSCILGWIRPSLFLIPLQNQQNLGISLYDTWKKNRKRRSLGAGIGGLQVGSWADKDWTPERIIAYYDPASRAEDGSWGYRTPIYMLNRIIRLQAVLEIAGSRIDAPLNTIATEQDKLRTAVYQNHLALDYLLAAEGGVCSKFNLTNCCLQINPIGKVVADLTTELQKVIHVSVQTWHGIMDDDGFLGGIFRNWKQAAFMAGIVMLGLLLLPCLMPIIWNAIQSMVENVVAATYRKQINIIHRPEVIPYYDDPTVQKTAFTMPNDMDSTVF